MKAYKCDICDHYCDDVLTIHGVRRPDSHKKYDHLEGTSADCCEACYDKVMGFIGESMRIGQDTKSAPSATQDTTTL